MKKLALLVAVVVMFAVVADASAYQMAILPGNLRLVWRDYCGAPNDSRVTAVPGETVFIQLCINSGSNQGNGKDFFLDADFDSAVIDTTPAPGGYVAVDTSMYMTFRDYQYQSGQVGNEIISYGGALDTINIDFNGPSNLYPYSAGPAGPPIGETGTPGAMTPFDYNQHPDYGSGGVIAGFWVPIRADAVVGSSSRFDVNIYSSGAWGGTGWHAALTEAGTEDWMDWANATMWVDSGEVDEFGNPIMIEVPVGVDYSMIITVVPEPATMGLLAVGGLLALIRRKK